MKIDKQKLFIMIAEKELTKKEFAEKSRMSQARLSAILNSERLQPKTIGRIANALNVHVEDIIVKEKNE